MLIPPLYRREARTLLALAAPMAVTQVAMMLMGVVDTLMVGRLGVEAIGAAALGSLWVFGTLFTAMGIVIGLDPVVSQAHGAGDGARAGRGLQAALVLSLLLTIPLAILWAFTADVLVLLGQDPKLAAGARGYTLVQIPAIPVFLGFMAVRQYLQGRGITTPAMVVSVLGNLVNVGFNWAFIHGVPALGVPALGVTGAGLATGLTRACLFAGLVVWVWKARLHAGAWVPWSRAAASARALGEILRPGLPVAAQLGLEIWAFQIGTLLAGRIGTVDLAAHTIVLNAASFSFMLPLGISMGAVTRVGNLVGARKGRLAQLVARLALVMGAGVMLASAVAFVALRWQIPRLYTTDPATIARAALVFPIAAAFQLFDGTQVVGGGILRGVGETRPAAAFNLLGYYVLGLPLAYVLAFPLGYGLPGVWWGFCLGLLVVALLLVRWVVRRGPGTARRARRV
jgi:MATE family multidrug resistance protein